MTTDPAAAAAPMHPPRADEIDSTTLEDVSPSSIPDVSTFYTIDELFS
jgi:hypothetical protein